MLIKYISLYPLFYSFKRFAESAFFSGISIFEWGFLCFVTVLFLSDFAIIKAKWFMALLISDWKSAPNHFTIQCDERMPQHGRVPFA